MYKIKTKEREDFDGKWMQVKVPTDLQVNIKVEALLAKKNFRLMCVEMLQLGYNTFLASKNNTSKSK